MSWDSVPYFTQYPGAAHDPEVFRNALYASTHGSEGVVAGTDCKVTALDVPGNAVMVGTGSVLILSRDVGGEQQTYSARNPTPSRTDAIPASGSSGGRSVMVVARVEDPGMDGNTYPDPSVAATGPYVFTRIVENVPSTATRLQDVPGHANDSGIALARIDIPASTATITAAMIVDLRQLAVGRSTRRLIQTATTGDTYTDASAVNTYVPFPQDARTAWPDVDVPAWATKVNLRAWLLGVYSEIGAVDGRYIARIGTAAGQSTPWTYFNEQTPNDTRKSYLAEGTIDIPASMRGTTQKLRVYVMKLNGSGRVHTGSDAQVKWDIEFIETPS